MSDRPGLIRLAQAVHDAECERTDCETTGHPLLDGTGRVTRLYDRLLTAGFTHPDFGRGERAGGVIMKTWAAIQTEAAAISAGTHEPAVDDFGNQYLAPRAAPSPDLAALRGEIASQVLTGLGDHFPDCSYTRHPGNYMEPPDPCSCGGPLILAVVDRYAAPPPAKGSVPADPNALQKRLRAERQAGALIARLVEAAGGEIRVTRKSLVDDPPDLLVSDDQTDFLAGTVIYRTKRPASPPPAKPDADRLQRAIADACPLRDPRLSEVDWEAVAVALDHSGSDLLAGLADELAANPSVLVSRDGVVAVLRERAARFAAVSDMPDFSGCCGNYLPTGECCAAVHGTAFVRQPPAQDIDAEYPAPVAGAPRLGAVEAERCGCRCGCHNTDHGHGCRNEARWLPEYGVWACDECLAYCDD